MTVLKNFTVIDVETTGLGAHDRVVEIAAVTLDGSSGQVVDEFDTLVNPMRDIGPIHIHGISAGMVSAAPTFAEIATVLASRLSGSVLVAHNLAFDCRMLEAEFDRLGASLYRGSGVCTLRLSGQKLDVTCGNLGIPLSQHHRALADARATAEILRRLLVEQDFSDPASVEGLTTPLSPRTLRREAVVDPAECGYLHRIVSRAMLPDTHGAVIEYLDLLDWVLDDLVITSAESRAMLEAAEQLGLGRDQIHDAHVSYHDSLVDAAKRDGVVSAEELSLLKAVAELLDVPFNGSVAASEPSRISMSPGMTVCFTGTTVIDGELVERSTLESLAVAKALEPRRSVTKTLDLLVAADPASMSGKAKKARDYGIPVMGVQDFLRIQSQMPDPADQ